MFTPVKWGGLGLSIAQVAARVHGASLALGDNRPGLLVTVQFGHGNPGAAAA